MNKTEYSENIRVFVRIRPPLPRELDSNCVAIVNDDNTVVDIQTETHSVQAKFDGVFGSGSTQDDVYEKVRFAAESVASGFNSTIFAYGQTGSGKSYTMFGPEEDLSIYAANCPSENIGIIPRAIREIIQKSNQLMKRKARGEEEEQISLYCSFLQIYNDQAFDLLRDPLRARPLQVHENTKTKEIYVVGLSEYVINSLQDCLALLEQGDEQRACRQTNMNDVSSRSHSIFQIVMERRKVDSGRVIRSKLNLVDLAGSEKWGILDTLEKDHVSELTNINGSLHTLARCIHALTDPTVSHVPFRDSKLTRILQDSFGGNSRTCVIATLSPSETFIEESISTLKFADRAKRVMQHARVVETREISIELVEKLEREIAHLRGLLASAGIDATSADGAELPQVDDEFSSFGGFSLEKQLFEANEKIRKLEAQVKQNGSGSSNNNGISNNAVAAGEHVMENKKLRSLVSNLRTCAQRFFKFEIEEEEFQAQFEKCLAGVSGLPAPKPQHGSHRKLIVPSDPRSGAGVSSPTGVLYRVRGKGQPGKADWKKPLASEAMVPPEKRGKSLTSSLKEKQKELAKHKKLQQWVAHKAQRELEKLENERRRMEQKEEIQRMRDKQFHKHASSVKRKLIKLKDHSRHNQLDEDRIESKDEERRAFPRIKTTTRPGSCNTIDTECRPLSRQTIFEENE